MNILCVCGMGIGTSILLKMNTEKALASLGATGTVNTSDISAARGAAVGVNLILTSAELVDKIGNVSAPIVVVKNFMDQKEIAAALTPYVTQK